MEVRVAKSRKRASRVFLAFLGLTILVGVVFYLSKPAAKPVATVTPREAEPAARTADHSPLAAPAQPVERVVLAQVNEPVRTETPTLGAKPAATPEPAASDAPKSAPTKPEPEPIAAP